MADVVLGTIFMVLGLAAVVLVYRYSKKHSWGSVFLWGVVSFLSLGMAAWHLTSQRYGWLIITLDVIGILIWGGFSIVLFATGVSSFVKKKGYAGLGQLCLSFALGVGLLEMLWLHSVWAVAFVIILFLLGNILMAVERERSHRKALATYNKVHDARWARAAERYNRLFPDDGANDDASRLRRISAAESNPETIIDVK